MNTTCTNKRARWRLGAVASAALAVASMGMGRPADAQAQGFGGEGYEISWMTPYSIGRCMNKNDQIGGYMMTQGQNRACVWTNGVPQIVDNREDMRFESQICALNDLGQAAGYIQTWSDVEAGYTLHACVFENGQITDIGVGNKGSVAYGINNSGQMTGWFRPTSDPLHTHTYAYSGAGMIDIGPAGVNSQGTGINGAGDIVGYTMSSSGAVARAFKYHAGALTYLPTLGGPTSAANSISDAGDICGWATNSAGIAHACIWLAGGGLRDLGGYQSGAAEVNDWMGIAVGTSTSLDGNYFAFVWTPAHGLFNTIGLVPTTQRLSGKMVSLTALGNPYTGVVCGYGYKDNVQTMFTLTPVRVLNLAASPPTIKSGQTADVLGLIWSQVSGDRAMTPAIGATLKITANGPLTVPSSVQFPGDRMGMNKLFKATAQTVTKPTLVQVTVKWNGYTDSVWIGINP